ncbi:MAG TPA: hypothetical protein VGV61_02670 [Thermoanaerobaculia bacterium]|nr:hypothetical protein [Thermoanaerobaculia bacterium]
MQALRAEIEALRAEYEQRLSALEQKLDALQGEAPAAAAAPGTAPSEQEAAANATGEAVPAAAPAAPAGEVPPAEPTAAGGAPAQTSNYFNPSISLIGNFLGVAGHNAVENLPSFDLRESELGLQAVLDPYARADVFIAFGSEGGNVEEGFVTFTSLPAGLLAKVGRIRAQFGKTNPLHLHVLPWADEPLPIVNLLGSEEGWAGDGISVAELIPLPGDTFSEATVQVFRGEREGLFTADKRSDLAYDLRYRVFRDLTEATNLDLGVSYAWGPTVDAPGRKSRLQGVDATLRWKPLQTASYRSFTLRGEAMRQQREQPGEDVAALGWFVSADYQLAKRWFVGGRYDTSDHADDDTLRDRGQALVVTFWPSEFSQLRAELRRRRYAGLNDGFTRFETTANELLLQLQFAMGAHGAHPF